MTKDTKQRIGAVILHTGLGVVIEVDDPTHHERLQEMFNQPLEEKDGTGAGFEGIDGLAPQPYSRFWFPAILWRRVATQYDWTAIDEND